MIKVTKTFFPPLEEYEKELRRIWKNEWLTNRGELVEELEMKLKNRFRVPNITLTTNGTLPLQLALKVLANGGEVITTPFSYIATTSAILWENCTPVFVDIDPEYLTIDETRIESAITSKTTAVLATHVFGNPCAIETIESIAKKYKLKVIYDAAHCFGVQYAGQSIFTYGDVSTCSFHATKIFHTGEGGAFFSNNINLHQELFYSHNFGHLTPEKFYGPGINAKMSELQAAMGLTVLPYMEVIVEARKKVVGYYDKLLDFSKVQRMKIRENTFWNYSYYPVIFNTESDLLKCLKRLNEAEIFPRRYFYPSLNTLQFTGNFNMPVSENIASKILCLPLYVGLEFDDINKIAEIIKN